MASDIIVPPPPVDWARRIATATFVVLFVFGLVLLVFPELATELDERSSGGRLGPLEEVTVTESKRTIEKETSSTDDSSTQATNRRLPSGVTNRGPRPEGRSQTNEKETDTQQSRDSSTTGEVQTTTTTTVRPTREDDFGSRAFAVPALFVLLRLVGVTFLAFVASTLVRWLLGGPRRSSPKASEEIQEQAVAAPSGGSESSTPVPVELPAVEPVTPQRAAMAKAEVIEGIPLLKEIFQARGEPVIDNTLPDMRLQVQLTDEVTKEQPLPVSLLVEDSALALATFRTELEQRLRRLSRDAIAQTSPAVDSILRQLVEEGLFESRAMEGFRELLRLTEHSLHGSPTDPAMTAWVRNEGVPLLMSLDLMLPS